jgi:tetratricopeptide (TPR) repeat protein
MRSICAAFILLLMLTMSAQCQQTAEDWYNKSLALYHQGKYDQSIKVCDKAIKLDPEYVKAWNLKGANFNSLGNYEDAIKCFDEAIRLDPEYATARSNKGFSFYQQGKYNESIKACDEAIRLDTNDTSAYNNKAIALYALGNYEDAIKAYDDAIRIDPTDYVIVSNKYATLALQGNLRSSSEFKGEPSYVLEIHPSNNQISPGDNLTLRFYIVGAGDVEYNKLRIDIPSYIVQDGTLEGVVNTFNSNFRHHYRVQKAAPILLFLPKIYFIGNESMNKLLLNDSEPLSNTGGLSTMGEPPIIINFTTSLKSPQGDQYIYTSLFYKNKGKWYVDKQALPIHIKYWYEEDRIQKLTFLALIGSILLVGLEFLKFLLNRFRPSG